jgi:hypothetical protein
MLPLRQRECDGFHPCLLNHAELAWIHQFDHIGARYIGDLRDVFGGDSRSQGSRDHCTCKICFALYAVRGTYQFGAVVMSAIADDEYECYTCLKRFKGRVFNIGREWERVHYGAEIPEIEIEDAWGLECYCSHSCQEARRAGVMALEDVPILRQELDPLKCVRSAAVLSIWLSFISRISRTKRFTRVRLNQGRSMSIIWRLFVAGVVRVNLTRVRPSSQVPMKTSWVRKLPPSGHHSLRAGDRFTANVVVRTRRSVDQRIFGNGHVELFCGWT